MGNFANTLFSVLLGWVQTATAWLWALITSDGANGLMGWVLDNWLALAIGLCLLGLVVDGIVYLIRWQPYRVWRSFLRNGEETEQPLTETPPEMVMQWVYANGEVAPEPFPAQEPVQAEAEAQSAPRARRRVIPARNRTQAEHGGDEVQQRYHQPYYPPQWNGGRYQPDDGGTKR